MASASTTGRSSSAAAMNGWMRVAAADLDRHHRAEPPAEMLLHHADGARDVLRVGEPLLADERRAHVGDHRDEVVVGERQRIEQASTTAPSR